MLTKQSSSRRLIGCLSAASVSLSALAAGTPTIAADFKKAKCIYVPPSIIERRLDYTSLREHQATLSSPPSGINKFSAAQSTLTTPTSGGLVPPPPPLPANVLSGLALPGKLKSAVSTAVTSPQAQAALNQLKLKAKELAASGKLDEARQTLLKALQMSPKDQATLKQMASVSLSQAKKFVDSDKFDEALASAREALQYDATSSEAHKVVDGLLSRTGINPADPAERIKAADLLAAQGRNAEAEVEYKAALKLKPSAEAHVGLGNLHVRNGQKEAAKHAYQQAIELDPNSALAHRQLGMLKLNNNDVVGANAALSRAVILHPSDKAAGKALVELWQKQVARVPGANSHLGLARAYQLTGDLTSAQTEYKTVVRLDPHNPSLPAARHSFKLALARHEAAKAIEAAHTLEGQGAIGEAYQKAYEAVGLSPGDASMRLYQGHLLEKLGRFNAARDAYMNTLRIDPHNTLAAARLKAIPEEVPAHVAADHALLARAQSLATPIGGAPPLAPPLRPAIPTPAPVANISNFATSLRNHVVAQKASIENVETVAQQILKEYSAPVSATSLQTAGMAATVATAPISAAAGAATSAAATAATTSGAAAETASAAADTGLPASVASALSSAASALSSFKSIGTPAAAATSAPAAAATAAPAATAPAAAAPAAPSPADMLLGKFPKLHSTYNKAADMHSKGKQMQDIFAKSFGKSEPAPASVDSVPTAPDIVRNTLQAQQPIMAPVAFDAPTSAAMAPATTSWDPNAAAAAASANLRGFTSPAPSNVHLELEGAQPGVSAVDLKVVLRNNADAPLEVPEKLKARIRYGDRHDSEVKVSFADKTVPPHSEIRGIIKVPFDKVDPTADLFIPNLLPAGAGSRDVHLTTSISLR